VRQSFLKSLKIKILRIWNNEIDENIDGVLEKIYSLIQNQPLPNPPLARGGEPDHLLVKYPPHAQRHAQRKTNSLTERQQMSPLVAYSP
jgi:hypothetical protein